MVRILIIDSNLIIRHVLKMQIELSPDLLVVGEDESGREAADIVLQYKPDVVIIDLDIPGSNGMDTVYTLHLAFPDLPIITTSLNGNESCIARSKEVGAETFVDKQSDSKNLLKAIRKATSFAQPSS
jgi:two-component system response regulator DegU